MLNISADAKKYQMELESEKTNLDSTGMNLEENVTDSRDNIHEKKQEENESDN